MNDQLLFPQLCISCQFISCASAACPPDFNQLLLNSCATADFSSDAYSSAACSSAAYSSPAFSPVGISCLFTCCTSAASSSAAHHLPALQILVWWLLGICLSSAYQLIVVQSVSCLLNSCSSAACSPAASQLLAHEPRLSLHVVQLLQF